MRDYSVTSMTHVSGLPQGFTLSPDGSRVYFAATSDHRVYDYDSATKRQLARVQVGTWPIAVALSPDGSRVYVANAGSDSVSVIDAATFVVIATIPVPGVDGDAR